MRRPAAIRSTLARWLAGISIALLLVLVAASPAAARRPPNIITVVTDDQSLASYTPRTMPATHRLLAGSGTTFTNAIAVTPLCCPSRATLLTGQYGHNNGVLANNPGYASLRGKANVLPMWLRQAGYRTAHIGKWMNGYEHPGPAPGWDEWWTMVRPYRYYGSTLSVNGRPLELPAHSRYYLTDVLSRTAAGLIRHFAPQPFYLQLDQFAPHRQNRNNGPPCPSGVVPPRRDWLRFNRTPLERTPSFNEANVRDKPPFARTRPRLAVGEVRSLARRERCARATLRSIDRGIALLHRTLRETGELDRTVIIFTTDNPLSVGEHRFSGKGLPYEEGIRVPLVIRGPRRYLGATQAARVAAPVANIDLAPTILDLADAYPCASIVSCRRLDGRSLLPLLRRQPERWPANRALLLELSRPMGGVVGPGVPCGYRGIRVGKQVYIRHTGVGDPSGRCHRVRQIEHYDLGRDPFQLRNLHPSPLHSPRGRLERRLAERLRQLRACSGIRDREPNREGAPYCE